MKKGVTTNAPLHINMQIYVFDWYQPTASSADSFASRVTMQFDRATERVSIVVVGQPPMVPFERVDTHIDFAHVTPQSMRVTYWVYYSLSLNTDGALPSECRVEW